MGDIKALNKFSFEAVRMRAWKVYSVGKGIFFTRSVSKIQFSMSSKRKNMYLLTKWEGWTEIFSCLALTHSVNKHFII